MKININWLIGFLFLGPTLSNAQLEKGSWMTSGLMRIDNSKFANNEAETLIRLEPELALMVTNSLMIGARLGLVIDDEVAEVSQQLAARHYFKSLEPTYFFYGANVAFAKRRRLMGNNGLSDRQFFRASLLLGMDHFVNRNVALEALINYHFLEVEKRGNNIQNTSTVRNRGLELQLKWVLFFATQLSEEHALADRRFHAGQWLVGGQLVLQESSNRLAPEFARFFSPHLALGLRAEYQDQLDFRVFDLAFLPFARYYVHLGRKKKIYAEGALGYGWEFLRNQREWRTSRKILKTNLSLGLANMLSPTASLDLILFYQRDAIRFDNGTELNSRELGFALALQTYIGK